MPHLQWRTIRYGRSVDVTNDFFKAQQDGNTWVANLDSLILMAQIDYSIFQIDRVVALANVTTRTLGFITPQPVSKIYQAAFEQGLHECSVTDALQLHMQWPDQPRGYVLVASRPFAFGEHRNSILSLEKDTTSVITISGADPDYVYPSNSQWIFRLK